jgi:hypothetical protein
VLSKLSDGFGLDLTDALMPKPELVANSLEDRCVTAGSSAN